MDFIIDKQTLDDLGIFGKRGKGSVYALYNHTNTHGGAALLEQWFRHPLSELQAIRQRSGIIQYLQQQDIAFPIRADLFDSVEQYLRPVPGGGDPEYALLAKGVTAGIAVFQRFRQFLSELKDVSVSPYGPEVATVSTLLTDADLAPLLSHTQKDKLGYGQIAAFDQLLRMQRPELLQQLLLHAYQLDVYSSVARVAAREGLVFPRPLPAGDHRIHFKGVYHPLVENAIGNDLDMDADGNTVFLTGANMAGKSTLMKSLGIAIFLAHVGFPVAAKSMEFAVRDGLYTTINLDDNLNMGYSHFYTEVMRVKKVAEELGKGRNIFVIFDELFRGTNVKDAYEATVAITGAFSRRSNCMFVVSTHIMEAGESLKEEYPNIQFTYLPTVMKGDMPVYPRILRLGVTADRHGMLIINNEGILDRLKQGIGEASPPDAPTTFTTDKQTQDDLNILGKYKPNSLFSLFNGTHTVGGERLLESWFRQPLSDAEAINQRSDIIRYFEGLGVPFPVHTALFDSMADYLGSPGGGYLSITFKSLRRRALTILGLKQEHYLAQKGLADTRAALSRVRDFAGQLEADGPGSPFYTESKTIHTLLDDPRLRWLDDPVGQSPSFMAVIRQEYLLKQELREGMEQLIQYLYRVDVYIAAAAFARKRGLQYARALPAGQKLLHLQGMYHPALPKAVANPAELDGDSNMIFLTGANMAGKSTYMKTFGTCMYLAHMGFPVPAEAMEFSVKEGIYSSINMADNLSMGYSHFYAEVLRVKKVAEEVASGKKLVVIFDELFKGTNVKDAYDGTLAVSRAFATYRNCIFIISTHIVEVGEALGADGPHVKFGYMPTVMDGPVPTYPYRLQEGISDDKHGMMIIRNEGILEMIAGN